LSDGYETLRDILDAAYKQASAGKGRERHANDKPFHDQPIMHIARKRGIGFPLGQADKKSEEAQGMIERGQVDAAIRELLGSIVYTAAAIMLLKERDDA